MAERENWKWAVPALDRCFFRCSRVTYSNCSRCLSLGERGRREEPPVRGGFPPLPGGKVPPRALPVPSATAVLPARSSSPGTHRARPGQPGSGVAGPRWPGDAGAPGGARGGGSTRLPAPAGSRPFRFPVSRRHHMVHLAHQQLYFPISSAQRGSSGSSGHPLPPQPPGAPALGITRGLRG